MKKLFLIGLPGAGKSYWAKSLAEESKSLLIDLDQEIVLKAGKSISTIFNEEGEATFRALESEVLQDLCSKHDEFIMACGGGTPCFLDNLATMKAFGQVIYLRASIIYILQHLQQQEEVNKRPLFHEEGNSLMNKMNHLLADRKSTYEKADHIIDIDRLSNDQVLVILTEIALS